MIDRSRNYLLFLLNNTYNTMENIDIKFYCDKTKVEQNALKQLEDYSSMPKLETLCAFTDIHYCDEKAIPVGVAFSSKDIFYPLVTGKDLGCGVMYLRVPKTHWLKPFNKHEHYNAFERAHRSMTDDGLGGGNHFLAIEEDDKDIYIICHTGSRNRGIEMFQHNYGLTKDYSQECGQNVNYVGLDYINEIDKGYFRKYYSVLEHAGDRRMDFVIKTLIFLQQSNYVACNKLEIPKDYLNMKFGNHDVEGKLYGTPYEIADSFHNHITFDNEGGVIHRKGSTELISRNEVVIPLSMSRGSLIVKKGNEYEAQLALNSCSHGAGRKLSRFDAMKYWRTTLKEKERKQYREKFSELLDRSGEFPSGYLQEFDYAYKDSDEILIQQSYLKKVTQTTPIVTVKYTEI